MRTSGSPSTDAESTVRVVRNVRGARLAAAAGSLRTSHVYAWVSIVGLVVLIGTVGYVLFLGWPIDDALYMTVITLTTVGFKEVRDLDDGGRVWTGLLSIAGVGIIFGTIGIVMESFVRDLTSGKREERRMAETIAALRGHFILCGYGRVGSTVAAELVARDIRVVVVDVQQQPLDRAQRDGHLVVQGDATNDDTLRAAGIARARGLVTSLDSDANNVYVVLSARALAKELFIVGRANAAGSESKLEQAGADRVVSPYTMAGRRIAELAIRPRTADFIDLALSAGDDAFSLEELAVEAGSPVVGRTVGQLRADGVLTLAILPDGGTYEANPPDDHVLAAGESLVLSGAPDRLEELQARSTT